MNVNIGVCVSGQMRAIDSWDTFAPYLKSNSRSAKVFLHTWKQQETQRVFRFFDHKLGQFYPLVYSNQEAIKKIQPNQCLIEENTEDVVDVCRGIGPTDVTRHRVLSMWRGQYKACELATKHDTFDIMCRTRSDIVFETDPFVCLEHETIQEGVVYIPEGPNGGDPECSPDIALHDWFGIAKPNTFVKFVSLYSKLQEYFRSNPTLFPEVMLKYHVDQMGLRIVRYPVKYFIKRV